jgi:translocator protein
VRPRGQQIAGLAACLGLVFVIAAVGAVASRNAGVFYGQLSRPPWAPSAGVFGPVWSILYALMGISAWLVWRGSRVAEVRVPFALFGAQLVANGLWSWLFFAWHRGGLAFGEVLLLCVLIAATIAGFWKVSRVAAALLIPYLGWVVFASALTYSVWQRNSALLG